MAEIAQVSGLSVGVIYRYFANKEAIVAAIVEQDLAEIGAKFAALETSGGPTVATAIDQCVAAVERNYDPARAALVLEVLAEAARNPRVGAIVREADAAERAVARRLLDQVTPTTGRSEEGLDRAREGAVFRLGEGSDGGN